jgi:hypothetical protein
MYTDAAGFTRQLKGLRGSWKPQDFSKRIMIEEDEILIASDLHVPYHDEKLLGQFFEHAQITNTQAIVFAGDLMDNPVFSSWGQEDLTTNFNRELQIAEGIVRMAASVAPRVYWSLGNHENRWMRKLGYQVDMRLLAQAAHLQDLLDDKTLVVSDNPTLNAGWNWMITHPATYGSTPLAVPGKIADLQRKHVISAHAHHLGKGKSPSGLYDVIESGCLVDSKLVKYVQHGDTAHRPWVQGYVSLSYGVAHIHEKD